MEHCDYLTKFQCFNTTYC